MTTAPVPSAPDVGATLAEQDALERVAALGWHGLEEEPLGDWVLRAAGGFTGRANSVLPLGDPGVATEDALQHVAGWYQARGLTPVVQVALPLNAALDAELAARGWEAYNFSHLLAGPVDRLVPLAERPDLPPARLDSAPTEAWLAGYHYRGSALPDGAAAVLAKAADPVFVAVEVEGQVVAVGRGVVDQGWLGVTAVTVEAAHRRAGLGSYVMGVLGRWGAGRGAHSVYLQVASENVAALAMYDRMGMRRHHDYQYRRLLAG